MSLININKAEMAAILEKMELVPFQFYLTGSRFFGHDKPASDWDFFVESHPDLTAWLAAHEFRKEFRSDYTSDGALEVWKHAWQPIHVQIVEDARLKNDVQKTLDNSGYAVDLYRMSRGDQRVIWRVATALFRAGKEQAAPCGLG